MAVLHGATTIGPIAPDLDGSFCNREKLLAKGLRSPIPPLPQVAHPPVFRPLRHPALALRFFPPALVESLDELSPACRSVGQIEHGQPIVHGEPGSPFSSRHRVSARAPR